MGEHSGTREVFERPGLGSDHAILLKANDAVACGSVMMYHSSGSRTLGASQVDFDHARESLDSVSPHAAFKIDRRCCCQASCCDHVSYCVRMLSRLRKSSGIHDE